MLLRQLFDSESSTYTYLLACEESRDAVLIDPVFEQHERDAALIRELGLTLRYVIDTHVHADHVTAAWLTREKLGAEIVISGRYGIDGVDVPVDHEDVLAFGGCSWRSRAAHRESRRTPSAASRPSGPFNGSSRCFLLEFPFPSTHRADGWVPHSSGV